MTPSFPHAAIKQSTFDNASASVRWIGEFQKSDAPSIQFSWIPGNRYVGSCICTESDDLVFLSIYFVCETFRHRGIGTSLLQTILTDDLKKKNIGTYTSKLIVAEIKAKASQTAFEECVQSFVL